MKTCATAQHQRLCARAAQHLLPPRELHQTSAAPPLHTSMHFGHTLARRLATLLAGATTGRTQQLVAVRHRQREMGPTRRQLRGVGLKQNVAASEDHEDSR